MDKNINKSPEKICKNCIHFGSLVFCGTNVGSVCRLQEETVLGRTAFMGVNPHDTCTIDKFQYKK